MSTERFHHQILDQIDEGVIALKRGTIIHVNKAMEAMTGLPRAQLLSLPPGQVLHPLPPLPQAHFEKVDHQSDGAPALESSLRMGDGQLRDVATSVHGIGEGEHKIDLVVVRDIGERKRMQQELLKSRQLESIAALSGGIAHDYNNLLTAIMGNISLALISIQEESPVHEWLSQAQDAALMAKELTNRLITFSKGGAPLKETVNLAGLIESATEFALSGSNIIAEFNIGADLWCADVDRTQIGQALHNIVINAREAMPNGGKIMVCAENETFLQDGPLRKKGRFLAISIKDEGNGVPPEAIDRIFDPYFSTKEMGNQRGMGLGLSIANSIVERHEGRILVEAPPGEGALFKVVLPASRTLCARAEAPQPHPEEEQSRVHGRILVMDDEAMIRKLAGSILDQLGLETAFAANGEEAVAAYAAAMTAGRPFDVVMLDLTVKGGMGGKEAIKQLRMMDPHVKAIVSSGYSNDPGVTRFAEFGFTAVVAKPYRVNELRQQLMAILD